MRKFIPFMTLFVFLFCFPAPGFAGSPVEAMHAKVGLISNVTGVKSGNSFFLGVDVAMDEGWDTYWRMPGEAGLPPVFDWTGSENIETPIIFWPAPERITVSGFDNFGYKGRVIFPALVKIKESGKKVLVKLKIDLLLCNNICVPQSFTAALDLPVKESVATPDAEFIGRAFSHVPVTVPPANFKPQKMWVGDKSLEMTVATDLRPKVMDVFVENIDQLSLGRPGFDLVPGKRELAVHIPLAKDATITLADVKKSLSENPPTVTFVTSGVKVESKMILSEPPLPEAPPVWNMRQGLALIGLALLGGLILNLMPCVLPVLSLKILSALHLGEKEQKEARLGFAAGALGIVASFWLLAGILAVLKEAGSAIGWGIQFQNPVFLGFLIVVIFLFAVNLSGLFEIPLPRFIAGSLAGGGRHPTLAGHFLTGMFATLLATPCSAPFLGTAIGFALASDIARIFSVFTFMGIGLALPWIAFAAAPQLARFLPRPGHWMITLRRILALLLFVTALWLATVLFSVVSAKAPATSAGWEVFSESRISAEVAMGKTVFVDVTADWCLTCKANKKFVLESADIQAALKEKNVLLLKADWTKGDEAIRAYLEKHGRYGIPFNIVYGPKFPDGIVLSELLTKQAVLDGISKASR